MEISESIFYIDSIATLNLLHLIDNEKDEIHWQFAIRSVDEFLNYFHYNLDEKFTFIENLKESFIKEHSESKELKLQLDAKFRSSRKQIEESLNTDLDSTRKPFIDLLEWKKEQIQPLVNNIIILKDNNQLQVELNNLLGSYLHMMLNRLFKSRQRTYEMVIYDFLYRHYKSKLARNKAEKTSPVIPSC